MNALEFIAFILIFGGALYFAWRDGFEQGVSAGNRRHVKQWSRLFRENRRLSERVVGLDNRMDEIEARLNIAEKLVKFVSNNAYGCKNVDILFADNKPYDVASWYPDARPETKSDGYKLKYEPEPDDICKTCTRQGTSICYGCGFDHVFYDKNTEKPEDWSCDTCVNDGDMSHLQCRYCNDGSCYVKKEEPLKFDHEPSGETVGKVVETEDTGHGMTFKISPYDEYTASNADRNVKDNAAKPNEEVVVKEDADASTDVN